MLDLYAELRGIVDALARARVDYALVGGLAVSIYATPRATEDIDLLVALGDLERTADVLAPLGFRRAGRPMRLAAGRIDIQRLTKFEAADLLPVDLIAPIDPALSHVLGDRTAMDWEGMRVWVIGVQSLRVLKRLRLSAQDRADLEALGPEPA